MELDQSHNNQSQPSPAIDFIAFVPRLWMVMVALAVPFAIISFNYFEALERTGPFWAFLADMLLPTAHIAYITAICILKRRKI